MHATPAAGAPNDAHGCRRQGSYQRCLKGIDQHACHAEGMHSQQGLFANGRTAGKAVSRHCSITRSIVMPNRCKRCDMIAWQPDQHTQSALDRQQKAMAEHQPWAGRQPCATGWCDGAQTSCHCSEQDLTASKMAFRDLLPLLTDLPLAQGISTMALGGQAAARPCGCTLPASAPPGKLRASDSMSATKQGV